jgi:predicted Zn-dependent protease
LNELAGNDSAAADNLREALTLSNAGQGAQQTAHQKLVQLLTKGKRYDDLVKEYQRAIVLQPKQSSLHLGLAEALIKTGKTDEAIKEATEAACDKPRGSAKTESR